MGVDRSKRRLGSGSLATIGLAVALIVTPALSLWGAFESYRAGSQAKYASAVSDAFEQAQYELASEESLNENTGLSRPGMFGRNMRRPLRQWSHGW